MQNEQDIIESLIALNYPGKCLKNDVLEEALREGPKSTEFKSLIGWLTHELHILRKTDEIVNEDVDFNEFKIELSAMLKELGCPYGQFVAGPLTDRFQTRESRIFLLDYLISELMAVRMSRKLKPTEDSYVISKFESNTARCLENITKDLQLGKPPENIAPKALFDKINFKVEEKIRQINPKQLSVPLLKAPKPLTDAQWVELEKIQKELESEYNLRRQTLITRFEVTAQSFQWTDRMKNLEDELAKKYQAKMKELDKQKTGGDDTSITALLAARADLAIIEKTSSTNVLKNTATKLQKHVIGAVPDRGGRAYEHAPPPPEMPSWQQQRTAGPGGRGGGGPSQRGGGGGHRGGGGGRGGRGGRGGGGGNQNWHQSQGHNNQNWSQPQGNPGFDFKPQLVQQSYSDNRQPNHQYQQRNEKWLQDSGRVQGGWSQRGGGGFDDLNQEQSQYSNRNSGGGSQHRGKSNYNRGGGGGGSYRR